MSGESKKRQLDLLASLDAAFASTGTDKNQNNPKQTAQSQLHQAYLNPKKKKRRKTNASGANSVEAGKSQQSHQREQQQQKPRFDPLYERIQEEILELGLRGFSLSSSSTAGSNGSKQRRNNNNNSNTALLNKYFQQILPSNINTEAIVTEKLKNKILQLENPIKKSKRSNESAMDQRLLDAQFVHQLSARQRRKRGIHMCAAKEFDYEAALQLHELWQKYVKDSFGNDFASVDEKRVKSKLNSLDLAGCRLQIVRSRNPGAVGIDGIVVAEKQNVLQICRADGRIQVIPKLGAVFRFALHDKCSVQFAGEYLFRRANAASA